MSSGVPPTITQIYSSEEGDTLVYDHTFLVVRPQVDAVRMAHNLSSRIYIYINKTKCSKGRDIFLDK